ncbi:MAG: diguanylate cyclase [Myxococcales bacterium]|nr:diguanylate cyclase [Myxococcales bacterium]
MSDVLLSLDDVDLASNVAAGRRRPLQSELGASAELGALGALHECSILLVDDDPIALKLERRILSEYANVRFATNGADAVRVARASPPDLILLDCEMPGQNGFEVCKLLKADPALREIPVIFVTAHDDVEFENLALTLGAADFISKPLSAAKVKLRVMLHLQLRQQIEALRCLANTDALTSLANRRRLDEALASEWSRASRNCLPLALLLIDIDFFKAFNDEYGHPAGDRCLRSVAQVINGAVRRPQDLACRFGGEEFAVILPHTHTAGALQVASTIRERLATAAIPHRGSSVADHVTVSIGISCLAYGGQGASERASWSPQPGDGELVLVDMADRALYAAKLGGRDRVEIAAVQR